MRRLIIGTVTAAICVASLALGASPCSNANGGNTDVKKVVLRWSGSSDLDLHVTGSTARHEGFKLEGGSSRTIPGQVVLDTSRGAGPGVEATTIIKQSEGIYQFYVHDYTARYETASGSLSRSRATIEVYFGDRLERTFAVPGGQAGNVWTACAVYGDEVMALNLMSDESDPGKVGRTLRTALIPGDILFGRIDDSLVPGAWSHVAIYAGDGQVVEAASENQNVGVRTEIDWQKPNMTWVSFMRVVTADAPTREKAVGFARRQVERGCPYDIRFYTKQANGGSWYCSELVWAAYLNASGGAIDLEHTPDRLGVYPWEIERSSDAVYIGGHYEREPRRSPRVAWLYAQLICDHLYSWGRQLWHSIFH
jgi:hypothetical protein